MKNRTERCYYESGCVLGRFCRAFSRCYADKLLIMLRKYCFRTVRHRLIPHVQSNVTRPPDVIIVNVTCVRSEYNCAVLLCDHCDHREVLPLHRVRPRHVHFPITTSNKVLRSRRPSHIVHHLRPKAKSRQCLRCNLMPPPPTILSRTISSSLPEINAITLRFSSNMIDFIAVVETPPCN